MKLESYSRYIEIFEVKELKKLIEIYAFFERKQYLHTVKEIEDVIYLPKNLIQNELSIIIFITIRESRRDLNYFKIY